MERKPDIDLRPVAAILREAHGVAVAEIAFLPVGADPEGAAWRVTAEGGAAYFLKMKLGPFDPTVLAVPRYLRDAGIVEVLAPLPTRDGALSVSVGAMTLILYPFVYGQSGFEVGLTPRGWTAFGSAMRRIHETVLPGGLARIVDAERFGSRWRDGVSHFMDHLAAGIGGDRVASELAALLLKVRNDIKVIVHRAAQLSDALRGRPDAFVLCHTDIHAGNVLIAPNAGLHIVDWDAPRFAPKERDLMFVGGGVGGVWNEPAEATFFYRGYGETEIDPLALAYYRYERIVEDIAVTCEQVFLGDGENRAESLAQLAAQWRPADVVAIAHATYAEFERRLRRPPSTR